MTDPDLDLDGFERQLHGSLEERASVLGIPDDGFDRISRRIVRHRRNRRAAWVAAAACLLIVVGVTAVALRPTSTESAPYVDQLPADDRPMVDVTAPPLLAPTGTDVVLVLGSWNTGLSYSFMVLDRSLTATGATTLPGPAGFDVRPGPTEGEPGPWEPFAIAGHPDAELRTAPDTSSAVRWTLAPGLLAKVQNSHSNAATDPVPQLRTLAESVSPLDEDTMLGYIDSVGRNGAPDDELQYRLGLDGPGRTYLHSVEAATVVSTLTVPQKPTNTFQLRSQALLSGTETLPAGEAVDVRGAAGVLARQTDLDGVTHNVLAWIEGNSEHRLYATDDIPSDEIVALAEQLQILSDSVWRNAVFPRQVPTDLAVGTPLWTRFNTDGEQTTATTISG